MTGTMRRIALLLIPFLPTSAAAAYASGVTSRALRSHTVQVAQIKRSTPRSFLLGDRKIESRQVRSASGAAETFPFRSDAAGTASSIEIYVDTHNRARHLIVGLYSNDSGPARRLMSGSLSSPQAGSWNSVPAGPAAIEPGRTYWVTVLGLDGALSLRARSATACTSEGSAKTTLDSLPRSWSNGRQQNSCHISAYVVGTVLRHGGFQTTPVGSGNPTGSAGPGSATTSAPTVSTPTVVVAPVNVVAPSVTGDPSEGQSLATSNGSWLASPTSYAYQWEDCDANGQNCTVIGGATSSSYVLGSGDVGHTVRSVVIATNAGGSTAADSAVTGVVGSEGSDPNPGNGLSSDPNFFPILVWDQSAYNASAYESVGVNIYENGVAYSSSDLATLKSVGMDVIECSINGQDAGSTYLGADGNTYPNYSPSTCPYDGRGDPSESIIKGWLVQPDEPDTAQQTGASDYGPCISPTQIQSESEAIQAGDDVTPKRPEVINFNAGVAVDTTARGSYCHYLNNYAQYMQDATIANFDVYPVNYGHPLDSNAVGVKNLHSWMTDAGQDKPVFVSIETTPIHSGATGPTPAQLHFEIWDSIIAGANGINYFCHIITPTFTEDGCLTISSIKAQMTADDAQIKSLAPVLNSNTVTPGVTASASFKVDVMTKSSGGYTYALTDADDANGGPATFTVPGGGTGTVTVLGENRTIPLVDGSFTDTFAGYGVHLYQIQPSVP